MSRYRYHLFFCTHTRDVDDERGCCAHKGSQALLDYAKEQVARRKLKRSVRVNETGCLNACATGPSVVVYPEGVWYRLQSRADVDAVIEQHLVGGAVLESLVMIGTSGPRTSTARDGQAKASERQER